MDSTLSSGIWKDSFDKLLVRQPLLRELNIIKQNVRASFNIDSSLENTNPNISFTNIVEPLKINARFCDIVDNPNKPIKVISTPHTKDCSTHLFRCALSPITGSQLSLFKDIFNVGINMYEDSEIKNSNSEPLLNRPECLETKSDEARQGKSSLLILQPGKWRKSLVFWRRIHTNEALCDLERSVKEPRVHENNKLDHKFLCGRKTISNNNSVSSVDYEKQVLMYCQQSKAIGFDTEYDFPNIKGASKIGEGVFGEVFKFTGRTNPKNEVVLKIIPIEGKTVVNGETQKTFEQILPEIVITKEMCNLQFCERNSTSGFVNIQNVSLVKGVYPQYLINLWDNFDKEKGSENDHPKIFKEHQLFVVLELKFAGQDLSTFRFTNAEQAYYAFLQIMTTLAVGELEHQFEHRDLHWGNILIKAASVKKIPFKLNGRILSIPSKGIRTTIIDYTLSRIKFNKFCYYNDLSSDEELFEATGDYQYDIYRKMRQELKNNWTAFAPKTNVLWLSYINKKMIDCVKYKSVNTKTHKLYVEKLKALQNIILTFESAAHGVSYVFGY
ncbi:serine/threonine-protein kinase haspin homolog isoform X2 [Drosophila tropicalis]|uniref:serine/threonine-protein kinase haspin homolog isoform X2 n=1 Tax=Drosophila tropicalis TaxID=46794 RepID=UPI0035AB85A6